MNVAANNGNSKWHSPMPSRPAEFTQSGVASHEATGAVRNGIDGNLKDTPGSHAFTQVSQDYSAGRHEAYDSQLAQPAYSGHGKVEVGKTSAL